MLALNRKFHGVRIHTTQPCELLQPPVIPSMGYLAYDRIFQASLASLSFRSCIFCRVYAKPLYLPHSSHRSTLAFALAASLRVLSTYCPRAVPMISACSGVSESVIVSGVFMSLAFFTGS